MPKNITTINNFRSGELSPYFDIRTDIDNYNEAAKQLENIIIWQHGGITKRPGTQYVWGDLEIGAE